MKIRRGTRLFALTLTGLLMVSACSSQDSRVEESQSPPSAAELMPRLVDEITNKDQLPEGFEASGNYAANSLRHLANSGYGEHFVAEGEGGELCLLTLAAPKEQGGDPEIASSTCPPVQHVLDNGILLETTGGESSFDVVSYLLPPDISEQSATDAISELVPENHSDLRPPVEIISADSAVLLVMTSQTSQQLGEFQLPRANGDSLTLRPIR
ncbi:MAG TPA: hypothetical protein DCY59_05530 [Micrococcaceae bacterium]|nr:hypothetical protein [Micrococcaceae bacterium]